jgi:hypothetical protein
MGWDGVELRTGETPESFIRSDIEAAGNSVVVMNRGPEGEFYVAVKIGKQVGDYPLGSVMGLVVLAEKRGRDTMFKWMDETMGPCYYKATRKLLYALTELPENSGYALKWRRQCYDNLTHKTWYEGFEHAPA